MGQHVAGGGGKEGGVNVSVDGVGDLGGCGGAVGKRLDDLSFAALAVGDQPCEPGFGVRDGRTVAGVQDLCLVVLQSAARGHEIREIPIGRRDERTGPAHNQIPAEDGPTHLKTQVIAKMAGRPKGAKLPALSCDNLVIFQSDIRGKILIHAFTAAHEAGRGKLCHHAASSGLGAAIGIDGRACMRAQRAGKRGVVAMRVGGEDMGDPLPWLQRSQDRFEVAGIVRARVDYGDLAFANEIGVRATIGHR